MSFIKKIFGSEPKQRAVTQVKDLQINDMISMSDSFGLPSLIRDQQFQVTAINCYEFEHKVQTEWVLSGQSDIELYLSLEVDDKTYLKFSLKIADNDVETLFDLEQFSTVFDEPGNAVLDRLDNSELTLDWSDISYQQQAYAQVGYFHRKDNRNSQLSAYEGKDSGEQFELYTLYNQDENKGIDIEVWQDGDTDVFLTLFRPVTDIVDMYPGS
ncbi:hypothetical protein HII17_11790 [Thalassotalea sp. M1531]|uniref:DUF4178 domain-containing protein n=1 Tax=Thalassotalea algicola TaxID=2716224 RepID=A0A7Y0LEL5_9GAMM|nr:hypothetical protein [Thalassotalea algicola]NMP32251.1 hypothetical protein [Thalassotalea algicola]